MECMFLSEKHQRWKNNSDPFINFNYNYQQPVLEEVVRSVAIHKVKIIYK